MHRKIHIVTKRPAVQKTKQWFTLFRKPEKVALLGAYKCAHCYHTHCI